VRAPGATLSCQSDENTAPPLNPDPEVASDPMRSGTKVGTTAGPWSLDIRYRERRRLAGLPYELASLLALSWLLRWRGQTFHAPIGVRGSLNVCMHSRAYCRTHFSRYARMVSWMTCNSATHVSFRRMATNLQGGRRDAGAPSGSQPNASFPDRPFPPI
jgi:hypothetical protein